jgi:hypothetical protein
MSIVLTMPENLDNEGYISPAESPTAEAAAEVAELLESPEVEAVETESTQDTRDEQPQTIISEPYADQPDCCDAIDDAVTDFRGTYALVTEQKIGPYWEWENRRRAAQDAHTNAACEVRRLAKLLKEAKKVEREALEFYESIRDSKPGATVSVTIGIQEEDNCPAPIRTVQPVEPDTWKNDPITCLGLKEALTKRLVESGIQTVGDLEALREKIAVGKEKWPKGIGTAKITDIENAMDKYWDDWRERQKIVPTPAGLEGVMSTATPAGVAKYDPDVVTPADMETTDGEEPEIEQPEAEQGEPVSDQSTPSDEQPDDTFYAFLSRLKELETWSNDRVESIRNAKIDLYENGALAKRNGDPVTACMYPEGESRDAWLLGWLNGDLAAEDPTTAAASSVELVDDLDSL